MTTKKILHPNSCNSCLFYKTFGTHCGDIIGFLGSGKNRTHFKSSSELYNWKNQAEKWGPGRKLPQATSAPHAWNLLVSLESFQQASFVHSVPVQENYV